MLFSYLNGRSNDAGLCFSTDMGRGSGPSMRYLRKRRCIVRSFLVNNGRREQG